MIWKVVVQSFSVLDVNIAWKVGDGSILRFGEDPWADTTQQHLLPGHTVEALRQRDIIYLYQLATPIHENLWFQSWRKTSYFGLTNIDKGDLEHYIGEMNRCYGEKFLWLGVPQ